MSPNDWNNGALNDVADLSITGGTPDPAPASSSVTTDSVPTYTDTTNISTLSLHDALPISVTETLPGANTGSYDTILVCDNGASPDAGGTFTVTAAMVATIGSAHV